MLPDDTGVGQREAAGDNCLCRPITASLHPVKVLYIGLKAGIGRTELAIGTPMKKLVLNRLLATRH